MIWIPKNLMKKLCHCSMNRLIVIFILYISSIATASAQYWSRPVFSTENDSTVEFVFNNKISLESLSLEARVAIKSIKSKNGEFGISWKTSNGMDIIVMLNDLTYNSNLFNGIDEIELKVTAYDGQNERELAKSVLTKNIGTCGNANSLQIKFTKDKNTIIYVGNALLDKRIELDKQYSDMPIEAALITKGKCRVINMNSHAESDKLISLSTNWTLEKIKSKIKDNSKLNGLWKYLDRQTDSRYTQLGGNYKLATIEEEDGSISIIYIEGAQTNRSNWQQGMKKGILHRTPLIDNYDLQWFDSQMNLIDKECYATFEQDGNILILNFPLLKSVLRFVKKPMGM